MNSPFDKLDESDEQFNQNLDTLPWIEKYRPKILDDIISHTDVVSTLKVFLHEKKLPHVLFYGPSGTGKTSTVMACAKELYGDYYNFMVMELNASDDRGIEIVRNKIKQFVSAKNVYFKDKGDIFKLVILDETDAMTSDAQAILRQVIEKHTDTTRFCLICNYIQNISPALQSRCQKFRFAPLSKEEISDRIVEIAKKENVQITQSGVSTLVYRSCGDMRKVLNNMQSVSMAYKVINEKNINTCLGYPRDLHIKKILHKIKTEDFVTAYEFTKNLVKDNGLSVTDIIFEIHNTLLSLIINNSSNVNNDYYVNILSKLRLIEYNQSVSTTENIQLIAVIALFKN